MVSKLIAIVALCCVVLCAGCSESDPVGSVACQEELAEKDAIIAAQESQIRSKENTIESQKNQIDALKLGLSVWENAPQSETIVKGTLRVSAGSYSSSAFTVTSGMRNARVQGHFQEIRGSGFFVYIFDDLNFRNWAARADSSKLYDSGGVVVGEIDQSIYSAGTYHLVFSNRHSWITQKIVDTAVDLWFET